MRYKYALDSIRDIISDKFKDARYERITRTELAAGLRMCADRVEATQTDAPSLFSDDDQVHVWID